MNWSPVSRGPVNQNPASTTLASRFETLGYGVVPGVLNAAEIQASIACCEELAQAQRGAGTSRAGIRDLLTVSPPLRDILLCSRFPELMTSLLGPGAAVVRSILFDKTSDANWSVTWHQDTTIAVADQHEASGFGPWSTKHGVPHVRPPASVLEQIATIRIHLDPCPTGNGPLEVIPGSHASGLLDQETISRLSAERTPPRRAKPKLAGRC